MVGHHGRVAGHITPQRRDGNRSRGSGHTAPTVQDYRRVYKAIRDSPCGVWEPLAVNRRVHALVNMDCNNTVYTLVHFSENVIYLSSVGVVT